MDPKSQISSLVRRPGMSLTLYLTCHVVCHPWFFDPPLDPQPCPHSLSPTQLGLAGPVVPSFRQSPRISLPKQPLRLQPVHMLMSAMVALANVIRLLPPRLLPIGAKAKAKRLSLLPLPPKPRPLLRPPYPTVFPLSPVPHIDFTPPGTRLLLTPNAI